MKLHIIAISDSDKHFKSPIDEYIKRMWKWLQISNIKPIKHWSREQIIQKETDLIVAKLEKVKWLIILMSKSWSQLSTKQLTEYYESHDFTLTFLIGWPYGLDESRMQWLVQWVRSFGQQTMPHGLAKLVLIEQLYRAQTIIDWKKYHY